MSRPRQEARQDPRQEPRQAPRISAARIRSFDHYFNGLQTWKVYGLTISGPRNQKNKGLKEIIS